MPKLFLQLLCFRCLISANQSDGHLYELRLDHSSDNAMSTTLIANGPQFVVPYRPDRAGVDFLGMRQVNVNMMAGVLPGINNVTWCCGPSPS